MSKAGFVVLLLSVHVAQCSFFFKILTFEIKEYLAVLVYTTNTEKKGG